MARPSSTDLVSKESSFRENIAILSYLILFHFFATPPDCSFIAYAMGCGSSKPHRQPQRHGGHARPVQLQNLNISGPVTPPGSVPALVRGDNGLWVAYEQRDLTRQNIVKALSYAAQYLHNHGENIVIVAVGGVVNTVLLKSRNATHDVDFFSASLGGRRLQLLRDAGLYAVERSSVRLSEDWLNNATARMPGVVENIDHLIQSATRQNDVIFQAPGLTVFAAPWGYAFVKKISRITQGTGRSYDAADAVSYLHQHIRHNGNKAVTIQQIRAWGNQYRALVPDLVLRQINDLYTQTYGQHGIQFH
ncbi:hypothetical protein SPI_08855 [Niveomyces insectorum RCEF 264]|uniref:DUF7582 domain-containing protein n=1 Tax=Niveomyces insectorum RCEF 264 TaxID=1081102 RepID=A0A167MPD3_9HYPO|nr:hypothetical protein SPI_08855 [Niveomyces insectorum RCEF 264]